MKKISDFHGQKVAVNCTTPEQAEAFCKLMHENGLKWANGNSYLSITYWEDNMEESCYSLYKGQVSHKDYFPKEEYTILPATDFLEEEFVYGKEYEFSSDCNFWYKEIYLCKTPNGEFVSYDGKGVTRFKYARKINTERTEAITTAKELITKFDIKQEELY